MTRLILMLPLLAGCAATPPLVTRFTEPALVATGDQRVDLAARNVCHSRDETPAVIETVTESRMENGGYSTEVIQTIVQDRSEIWFTTPCLDEWTPDFISSVQRALIARELMEGPASGVIDTETRSAIRAFQKVQGIDSDVLSVAAGKRLGLIVYDRDEALAK